MGKEICFVMLGSGTGKYCLVEVRAGYKRNRNRIACLGFFTYGVSHGKIVERNMKDWKF